VFKIVVSSDSMKNATATSHGKSRLLAADREKGTGGALMESSRRIKSTRYNYFTNVAAGARFAQLRCESSVNPSDKAGSIFSNDGTHLKVKEFEHEPVFESETASSP